MAIGGSVGFAGWASSLRFVVEDVAVTAHFDQHFSDSPAPVLGVAPTDPERLWLRQEATSAGFGVGRVGRRLAGSHYH